MLASPPAIASFCSAGEKSSANTPLVRPVTVPMMALERIVSNTLASFTPAYVATGQRVGMILQLELPEPPAAMNLPCPSLENCAA